MTVVDDRTRAIESARAASHEDFWATLLPEAAELVVTSGLGSVAMLQRKMRLPYATVSDLMAELCEAGIVGPDKGAAPRDVLVPPDGLADALAGLAELADPDQGDAGATPEEVAVADVVDGPPPLVNLVKPPPAPGGQDDDDPDWWDDDEPGAELELRPHHPLARIQYVTLAPVVAGFATRARQATARQLVWVADQPLVSRSLHVGRQVPRATWRLALATPRGSVRISLALVDWLRDARSAELLAKHAEAGEGESYAKVARARLDADVAGRNWRVAILATLLTLVGLAWWAPTVFATVLAVAVFVGAACLAPRGDVKEWLVGLGFATALAGACWWWGADLAALIPQPPVWVWWVLAGVAVVACGIAGRQEDKPIIEKATTTAPHKPPVVTAPMVIDALCSLGNSKMRFPEEVSVIMDPRQAGAGTLIDLEMPKGVPASFVVKNREPLAAAMRHPLGCVWPAVGLRHPGHLSLYVSDQVMVEALQKPWPLADGVAVDIFRPLPQVTNQRGDWVDLVLAYASVVIGAQPRMGKTYLLRQLLLVAGLDVRTKVASLDGKGTGDLAPTRLFADFYSVGDDPEEIEDRVLTFLREVRVDMRRRAKFIRDLPHEEAPESKVTSELADRYPDVLAPRVIGIDETQSYFGYGDKKNNAHKAVREEITAIVTDLVKRGPALGIWVILATQNVSEETIPRQISLNAVIRAAMKLFDDSANNMVLGSGAYGKGVDATQFDFTDKGLMWLRGDGDRPFIGRSVVGLDAVAGESLAAKARALRLAAGRLTGAAADDGIVDAVVVVDILADAEDILMDRRRDAMQYPELLNLLREMRPDHYEHLDIRELSARMPKGPDGNGRQVWANGKNGRGVRLDDLRKRHGAE